MLTQSNSKPILVGIFVLFALFLSAKEQHFSKNTETLYVAGIPTPEEFFFIKEEDGPLIVPPKHYYVVLGMGDLDNLGCILYVDEVREVVMILSGLGLTFKPTAELVYGPGHVLRCEGSVGRGRVSGYLVAGTK